MRAKLSVTTSITSSAKPPFFVFLCPVSLELFSFDISFVVPQLRCLLDLRARKNLFSVTVVLYIFGISSLDIALQCYCTSCWTLRLDCSGFGPMAFIYCTTYCMYLVSADVVPGVSLELYPLYIALHTTVVHRGGCNLIVGHGFGGWSVELDSALTS